MTVKHATDLEQRARLLYAWIKRYQITTDVAYDDLIKAIASHLHAYYIEDYNQGFIDNAKKDK